MGHTASTPHQVEWPVLPDPSELFQACAQGGSDPASDTSGNSFNAEVPSTAHDGLDVTLGSQPGCHESLNVTLSSPPADGKRHVAHEDRQDDQVLRPDTS